MTRVMNQGACEVDQAPCEMTADELDLVSGGTILGTAGGSYPLGPAVKGEGFPPCR
jgi:hypothetical protein